MRERWDSDKDHVWLLPLQHRLVVRIALRALFGGDLPGAIRIDVTDSGHRLVQPLEALAIVAGDPADADHGDLHGNGPSRLLYPACPESLLRKIQLPMDGQQTACSHTVKEG